MAAEVKKAACSALVVKYVHDTRTGEALNIGVLLLCPERDFAAPRFLAQWSRITGAFPDAEPVHLRRVAAAFERACVSWIADSAVQRSLKREEDVVAFARSVLHDDDGNITLSAPITGVTGDPRRTLDELFMTYVGRYVETPTRPMRDDADIWRTFVTEQLPRPEVFVHLQPHTIRTAHYEHTFDKSWMNGKWNAAQPLSLDLNDATRIREKAAMWSGRIITLRPNEHDTQVWLLIGMPQPSRPKVVLGAARDALEILRENLVDQANVLPESDSQRLALKIAHDLAPTKSDPADLD